MSYSAIYVVGHRFTPSCESLEPPVGIEPTTYALRGFLMPLLWRSVASACEGIPRVSVLW